MARELLLYLDHSLYIVGKTLKSNDAASQDLLFRLRQAVCTQVSAYTRTQIKCYLNNTAIRTQYLSLHIKLYMTHDLFANKSFTSRLTELPANTRALCLTVHF
jgi:hypothetical protein